MTERTEIVIRVIVARECLGHAFLASTLCFKRKKLRRKGKENKRRKSHCRDKLCSLLRYSRERARESASKNKSDGIVGMKLR